MQTPSSDESAPIVDLDHDHDDLTVLLQDLHAQVRQAMADESRSRALGSARQLLRYFHKDMQSHFEREERMLFPLLRQYLPDRSGVVDGLARAHEQFDRQVALVGELLEDDGATRERLQGGLARIDRLLDLFAGHSRIEGELITDMDACVVDAAVRARLRAELAEL